MSKDSKTPLQRRALALVRAEMRLYDALSRQSRLRYEPQVASQLDAIAEEKLRHHEHGTRSCGHGVALHTPCSMCCRTEEDCIVYRNAATQRIKDLLKQLGDVEE